MRWIVKILFFVLVGFSVFSQDSIQFSWKQKFVLQIDQDVTWSVDNLENHYLGGTFGIKKYDSVGTLKFQQSLKSLGNTSALVPINSMKLVHFSEEQQTLCYFDNTLTVSDDCIDLVDEGIVNAVEVCRSSQPNKLWVLDNVNSTLFLLSLDESQQRQEIKNLRGILDLNHVTRIIERNNQLLMLDREKGVFIFDLYGALIEHLPELNVIDIDATESSIILLKKDEVEIMNRKTMDKQNLPLPLERISQMKFVDGHFFFRNYQGVYKFAVQISK